MGSLFFPSWPPPTALASLGPLATARAAMALVQATEGALALTDGSVLSLLDPSEPHRPAASSNLAVDNGSGERCLAVAAGSPLSLHSGEREAVLCVATTRHLRLLGFSRDGEGVRELASTCNALECDSSLGVLVGDGPSCIAISRPRNDSGAVMHVASCAAPLAAGPRCDAGCPSPDGVTAWTECMHGDSGELFDDLVWCGIPPGMAECVALLRAPSGHVTMRRLHPGLPKMKAPEWMNIDRLRYSVGIDLAFDPVADQGLPLHPDRFQREGRVFSVCPDGVVATFGASNAQSQCHLDRPATSLHLLRCAARVVVGHGGMDPGVTILSWKDLRVVRTICGSFLWCEALFRPFAHDGSRGDVAVLNWPGQQGTAEAETLSNDVAIIALSSLVEEEEVDKSADERLGRVAQAAKESVEDARESLLACRRRASKKQELHERCCCLITKFSTLESHELFGAWMETWRSSMHDGYYVRATVCIPDHFDAVRATAVCVSLDSGSEEGISWRCLSSALSGQRGQVDFWAFCIPIQCDDGDLRREVAEVSAELDALDGKGERVAKRAKLGLLRPDATEGIPHDLEREARAQIAGIERLLISDSESAHRIASATSGRVTCCEGLGGGCEVEVPGGRAGLRAAKASACQGARVERAPWSGERLMLMRELTSLIDEEIDCLLRGEDSKAHEETDRLAQALMAA